MTTFFLMKKESLNWKIYEFSTLLVSPHDQFAIVQWSNSSSRKYEKRWGEFSTFVNSIRKDVKWFQHIIKLQQIVCIESSFSMHPAHLSFFWWNRALSRHLGGSFRRPGPFYCRITVIEYSCRICINFWFSNASARWTGGYMRTE